jgi:hypothetical protein
MKYEQNVATIDNGQCVVNQTKKMAVGATASNDHQLVRYPFRLLLDESWINDRTNLGRCFWHTCGLLLHFFAMYAFVVCDSKRQDEKTKVQMSTPPDDEIESVKDASASTIPAEKSTI